MVWKIFRKDSFIEERISEVHTILESSFSKVKEDIDQVGEWIRHFDNYKDEQHKKFINFEERLRSIEQYIINSNENKNQTGHSENEHVQSFNRSIQPIMNVQKIDDLTPAQKQVVGILIYSGGPLSYEDISNKLKINVVTVRRHINDIKRAGFKIKEKVSVKNRRKMFMLDEDIKQTILNEK